MSDEERINKYAQAAVAAIKKVEEELGEHGGYEDEPVEGAFLAMQMIRGPRIAAGVISRCSAKC